MDGILSIVSWRGGSGLGSIAGLEQDTFFLVLLMSFLGAIMISRATGFENYFNMAVNFVVMLICTRTALKVLQGYKLQFGNELITSAIYCNVGMAVAGVLLVIYYSRSDKAGN